MPKRRKTKSRPLHIEERLGVFGFVSPLAMVTWYAVAELTRGRRVGMDRMDTSLDNLMRIGGLSALEWLSASEGRERVKRAIKKARDRLAKDYPGSGKRPARGRPYFKRPGEPKVRRPRRSR